MPQASVPVHRIGPPDIALARPDLLAVCRDGMIGTPVEPRFTGLGPDPSDCLFQEI
jgi:hypothetical protein